MTAPTSFRKHFSQSYAEAHGLAPEEVESLITIPIEAVMNGKATTKRLAMELLVTRGYIGVKNGMLSEAALRTDIARFEIDTLGLALAMERFRDEAKAGASLGAVSSMLKYYGTELNMRRQELLMAIGGSAALDWAGGDNRDGDQARLWLRSRGNSIEGGTTEIQLNIVAKRILGLPG